MQPTALQTDQQQQQAKKLGEILMMMISITNDDDKLKDGPTMPMIIDNDEPFIIRKCVINDKIHFYDRMHESKNNDIDPKFFQYIGCGKIHSIEKDGIKSLWNEDQTPSHFWRRIQK